MNFSNIAALSAILECFYIFEPRVLSKKYEIYQFYLQSIGQWNIWIFLLWMSYLRFRIIC